MKSLLSMLMFVAVFALSMFAAPKAEAQFTKEIFRKQVYFAVAGCAATNKGSSYSAPKCFGDVDVWAIPAGTVIEKVYVVVDTAVAGMTAVTIGDDDAAAGYAVNASITLGTPGMYGWDAKNAGSYLRILTAGVTDPADPYVVPNAKYYAAAGKEIKMDATNAATGASKMRVVIEGYSLGLP